MVIITTDNKVLSDRDATIERLLEKMIKKSLCYNDPQAIQDRKQQLEKFTSNVMLDALEEVVDRQK